MKNKTIGQIRYKKEKEIKILLRLKNNGREKYLAKKIAIKVYGFPYIY